MPINTDYTAGECAAEAKEKFDYWKDPSHYNPYGSTDRALAESAYLSRGVSMLNELAYVHYNRPKPNLFLRVFSFLSKRAREYNAEEAQMKAMAETLKEMDPEGTLGECCKNLSSIPGTDYKEKGRHLDYNDFLDPKKYNLQSGIAVTFCKYTGDLIQNDEHTCFHEMDTNLEEIEFSHTHPEEKAKWEKQAADIRKQYENEEMTEEELDQLEDDMNDPDFLRDAVEEEKGRVVSGTSVQSENPDLLHVAPLHASSVKPLTAEDYKEPEKNENVPEIEERPAKPRREPLLMEEKKQLDDVSKFPVETEKSNSSEKNFKREEEPDYDDLDESIDNDGYEISDEITG